MLYTCLVICLFSYKLIISCSISLISFFELRAKELGSAVLLVSNCAKKVNNFLNYFCEVNTPLPFLDSFLSLFSNFLISFSIEILFMFSFASKLLSILFK